MEAQHSQYLILSVLCAATALLGVASARMGAGSSNNNQRMSQAVDFQTFELDGEVRNLLWCGNNDEIILLQTSDGGVYRSRDRGSSWKRLKALFNKHGGMVADAAKSFQPGVLYPYHYDFGETDTAKLVELMQDTTEIDTRIWKTK